MNTKNPEKQGHHQETTPTDLFRPKNTALCSDCGERPPSSGFETCNTCRRGKGRSENKVGGARSPINTDVDGDSEDQSKDLMEEEKTEDSQLVWTCGICMKLNGDPVCSTENCPGTREANAIPNIEIEGVEGDVDTDDISWSEIMEHLFDDYRLKVKPSDELLKKCGMQFEKDGMMPSDVTEQDLKELGVTKVGWCRFMVGKFKNFSVTKTSSEAVDVSDHAAFVNYIVATLQDHVHVKENQLRGTYGPGERLADYALRSTQNRDVALAAAISYICDPPYRSEGQSYAIAATYGAPGTGKSHLLDEIVRLDFSSDRDSFEWDLYLPLIASFNGRTISRPKEVRGLCIRLLLSYFVGLPPLKHLDGQAPMWSFKEVAEMLDKALPECSVRDVIAAIEWDVTTHRSIKLEKVKVLFMIDEIGKAANKDCDAEGVIEEVYRCVTEYLECTRYGAVFTALDGTDILPSRVESTSSSRPIAWLPLQPLDTTYWENEAGDEYASRLFAMSGGHPRTIQFLLKELKKRVEGLDASLAIMERVAVSLQVQSLRQISRWIFPAILATEYEVVDDRGNPTNVMIAIERGILINAVVTTKRLEPVVPKLSLFLLYSFVKDKEPLLLRLLSQLIRQLCTPVGGFGFEDIHSLRELIVLNLIGKPGRCWEIFSTETDTRDPLYAGARYVTDPTPITFQVQGQTCWYKISKALASPTSTGWTVQSSILGNCRELSYLPVPIVLASNFTNNKGFDIAELLPTACGPHLILIECKYSKGTANTSFSKSDCDTKAALVDAFLSGVMENKEHPFHRCGIDSKNKVTLIFVLHRECDQVALLRDPKDLTNQFEFGIAIMPVYSLRKCYGPTLSSAVGFLGWDEMN
eukprot:CAMPEP_0174249778 /NCGR_PEP_ID=MMETSP0439-20130205/119_1 /TAXON_ID=0 /ORGANISM="Stereomyxa ramosa, Strain Chinc5" /LENGTH=865 /DNA_ID=CAMNT_0015329681 /DNA_START=207 /DNA_END=2804 /DNA_ORIENTATION=-